MTADPISDTMPPTTPEASEEQLGELLDQLRSQA